jgi:hypothetical protein
LAVVFPGEGQLHKTRNMAKKKKIMGAPQEVARDG